MSFVWNCNGADTAVIESVSLCMVTYNEGHRIFETLRRAEEFVDEVVVVDQRSTDSTVKEIERFASQTDIPVGIHFDRHWGFCEPSRKLAHNNSVGDWVLVLDADECISGAFALEMRTLDEIVYEPLGQADFYRGCRLQRSLFISGTHSWTGDYQYRYFQRKAVRYLSEIHTEPQPTIHPDRIYWKDYVGIVHRKTWQEQIRDEEAYMQLLRKTGGIAGERKRAVSSVYTNLLKEAGVTAAEADAMTQEQRESIGLGLSPI